MKGGGCFNATAALLRTKIKKETMKMQTIRPP